MLDCILVDDERPALRELGRLLDDIYLGCSPGKARQRLYNDRYYLRHQLAAAGIGDSVLRLDGAGLYVSDRVWCDVDDFERALAAPTSRVADAIWLRRMVGLAAGPYLGDAEWPWAEGHRDKLRAGLQNLLRCLVEADLLRGEAALAEANLMRALENDPYDEGVVLTLVRLYRDSGRPLLAQRCHEAFCERLARDIGAWPSRNLSIHPRISKVPVGVVAHSSPASSSFRGIPAR